MLLLPSQEPDCRYIWRIWWWGRRGIYGKCYCGCLLFTCWI